MDTQQIALADLRVSPLNVRKTLAGISELADVVRSQGVLQPLIVRRDTFSLSYEIAAGQRRYHAAKQAGLSEVPCIVRTLTDAELVEVSLVENLDREGVSPLEEADAIQALINRGYRTEGQLAAKIGKPARWVSIRRGLLNLCAEARAWCSERGLSVEHMAPLSNVDHEAQRDVIAKWGNGTVPSARAWAHEITFSLRLLSGAPFPLADKTLGGRGACEGCTQRSDRQTDLFADHAGGQTHCLDRVCWTVKADTLWERAKTKAGRSGVIALESDKKNEIFRPDCLVPVLQSTKETEGLTTKAPSSDAKPVAIARTDRGQVVELYRVEAPAKPAPDDDDTDEDRESTEPDARRVEREQQVAERAAERRTRGLALLRVLGTQRGRELAMRSALAVSILEAGDDAPRFALGLLGLGHLDCNDKTLPEVVPAEHLEAVELFAMTEAVIGNGEAEDTYDVELCAMVAEPPAAPEEPATPMVRVWIAEGEWDSLTPGAQADMTELGAGVTVEWEGKVDWVTAQVAEGLIPTLVEGAEAFKVVLYQGEAQPAYRASYSVRETDWKKHQKGLLDADGGALHSRWIRLGKERCTMLSPGSTFANTITDYCRSKGLSLKLAGQEVAGSAFKQPTPPKSRAKKVAPPKPELEEEPEDNEEEEDESEEEEEFDDDDNLSRHTRDGAVVFDRDAEVARG